MANKIIVGTIRTWSSTPTDSFPDAATWEFADGQTVLVGPDASHGNTYSQVLADLQTIGAPAYVEVDPDTNAIQVLLIPVEGEVSALHQLPEGDVMVELEPSSAQHFLRASNPSFGQFMETLQGAQANSTLVLVTETPDSHEILDVRMSTGGDQGPNPPQPAAPPVAPAIVEAIEGIEAVVEALLLPPRPITQHHANQLFAMAHGLTCLPAAINLPCIPFLYPDEGCWARAQQMCNIFLSSGANPGKVWNYGDLHVKTRNNPKCKVSWVYHVAPVFQVTSGGAVGDQVIDPSLFNAPVTVSAWVNIQGDPTATQATSDASVFYRSPKGKLEFDTTGNKTTKELALCRLRFKLRCTSIAGPPPYSACP